MHIFLLNCCRNRSQAYAHNRFRLTTLPGQRNQLEISHSLDVVNILYFTSLLITPTTVPRHFLWQRRCTLLLYRLGTQRFIAFNVNLAPLCHRQAIEPYIGIHGQAIFITAGERTISRHDSKNVVRSTARSDVTTNLVHI